MRLNELTIAQAAAGLRKKEFSVTELVSHCIDTIKEKNEALHAFLDVFEDARTEAARADEMRAAAPDPHPLLGIPLAIKDNILIKGKRATAGSKILAKYI